MTIPPLHLSCGTADEAGHIVSLLISRNVKPEDIEVLSAEPLHELGETISGKSRLPAFVLTGAALGIVAGWSMAALTALLYPVDTGGMPIVARLPAGIVTYESMMLLAVLFTLGGMLLEGRLLRRRCKEYEECADSIIDGEIHIFARVASDEESEALRLAVETGPCGSET
jgi:hypothetical protein